MPAVTQRIPNYLGGVSKQSDDKMLPGQVREAYNAFPDATYGLTKRPGFEHLINIGTGDNLDNRKWFYINRDDDETYIGCVLQGEIKIWNALSGVECTVTTFAVPTGVGNQTIASTSYLSSANPDDYKLITIQDTTIVINSSVAVEATPAPVVETLGVATIVLEQTLPDQTYEVTINDTTATITSHSQDFTFDDVLTDKSGHNLKDAIEAAITAQQNIYANQLGPWYTGAGPTGGTYTVERNGNASLNIFRKTPNGDPLPFTVSVKGGSSNASISAFQDEVRSVGQLPIESFDGHTVKIANTVENTDDYYATFRREFDGSSRGYWEESRAPNVSPGVKIWTMPHELVNTGLNTFTFKQIEYDQRLVGDDVSNSHPSFVGSKITSGFFHNNRLGFTSGDNVCMSRSGSFYNFYFETAQATLDSDPIDLSCSSIVPTALHAVLPTAQGVLLFSSRQQFLLFSDSGVLTPTTSTIRAISNFEMTNTVDPVDVGTNINFISKTPGYTRVFSMVTKGQQQNPQVLDLSRVVKEWISPNIDHIVASPQNSMVVLSSQSEREIYLFKYYSDGEKNLMEAWTSWLMPGTCQFLTIDSDDMYAVTKQGNQFSIIKAVLSQSPEQAIIVNSGGQRVNPCMDLYKTASSVVYDSVNNLSKCYLPYNDVPELTPVLITKGNTSSGTFVESGFTITPERASDATGPYFIVPQKDFSNIASDVIVGFKYNFDVHLPATYFRLDEAGKLADFTASLTISRMKFSVGLSGALSFKINQRGRNPYYLTFTGDGSTTTYPFNKRELDYQEKSDVLVKINDSVTTDFSFLNDTTIVFNTAPPANSTINLYIQDWFLASPVIEANTYLANDVPLDNESVFAVPIHQRTENFKVRMFNNTPFPISVNSMMWEGNYTPRFYGRK
tara:strand:- start:4903 stop:7608 length:2706 start_codon:yes stop_codon:yes gene_type:complete